jgi:hypothetical protein
MALAHSPLALGDALVREGIITTIQLKNALEKQRETGRSLGRVLVDLGFITEAMRMAVLQKTFNFEMIGLKKVKIDPAVLNMIPRVFAEKHGILPIRLEGGGTLVVAMEDPSDLVVIDAVKSQVGMNLKTYLATSDELAQTIRERYGGEAAEGSIPATAPVRRGLLYRVLAYCALPVLMFLPLAVLILLIVFHQGVQSSFYDWSKFDFGLYTLLGWGLWAVVLYELNALIFKDRREREEA